MASPADAQAVERIINYEFQRGYDLLLTALTAAGVTMENWDGNRRLAQLGAGLSEFLLNYLAYEGRATRAYTNEFKSSVTSKKQRASIAERTGISKHIKYSEKGGARSPSVLGKAVNAIIAAVFLDCGSDINIVLRIMKHLGIFCLAGQPINPALLSVDVQQEPLDANSLACSLFRSDVDDCLPLTTSSTDQTSATCCSTQPPGIACSKQASFQTPTRLGDTPRTREPCVGSVDLLSGGIARNPCAEAGSEEALPSCDTVAAGRGSRKKRNTVDETNLPQRKRIRECVGQSDLEALEAYLIEESRKGELLGHRPLQDTFVTPTIQTAIQNLDGGDTVTLAKILVLIASPSLISALQETLKASRTPESCRAINTTAALSSKERFDFIVKLDCMVSIFQLLRRYHILELFKDCASTTTPTIGIVLTTSSDFASPSRRRGNPANRCIADVTVKMMQDAFPAIAPDTDTYRSKYRLMTYIRRLGQRLHILERRFGRGILGLIIDRGSTDQTVGITDAMIMGLADAEYEKFVEILDNSQGDLLRAFSGAVLPVVQALTGDNAHQQRPFKLEKVTVSDIMRYPKGSQTLLELVTETT